MLTRGAMRRGDIPVIRIGRSLRYSVVPLEKYLKSHEMSGLPIIAKQIGKES
jgi:hypothetical protein